MTITKDEILKIDFDRKNQVRKVLKNTDDRDLVVTWITTDPNIIIYYQCFYILQDATEIDPEKFIKYWNDFVKLIDHENSYHRDIGYTIIGNLVKADSNKKLDIIINKYFEGIYDNKFKTAVSCINNLKKIAGARIDMVNTTFDKQIIHKKRANYPMKQDMITRNQKVQKQEEYVKKL